MADDDFRGFGPGTTEFLADLRDHNDRGWFDANRDRYQQHWMAPAKAFVTAAGEALQELSPGISAEPKVNGSIFRINRDTRFSADKTPYKDHLDLWFWSGPDRRSAVSGYYLRITPDVVGVGVGSHGFDPTQLATYRERVVDPAAGASLLGAVAAVGKAGFAVAGEHYKRTPKGFDDPADPALATLLRHNALFVGHEEAHPASMRSARFVPWCVTRWRKMQPVHDWLDAHLG